MTFADHVTRLVLAAVGAALAAVLVGRGCEHVVPDPLRGPAPQVHPAIRAWDAGVRE